MRSDYELPEKIESKRFVGNRISGEKLHMGFSRLPRWYNIMIYNHIFLFASFLENHLSMLVLNNY